MRKPPLKTQLIPGQVGCLEILQEFPSTITPHSVAICTHPHPLYQGNLNNKVVYVLASAFRAQGHITIRMNFRGVGSSDGRYDEGKGEVQDILKVIEWVHLQHPYLPISLAGVSFGAFTLTHLIAQYQPTYQYVLLLATPHTTLTCAEVPTSCAIIHGEHDERTSLVEILKWAATKDQSIVVLPNTSHLFDRKLHILNDVIQKTILSFTTQRLLG